VPGPFPLFTSSGITRFECLRPRCWLFSPFLVTPLTTMRSFVLLGALPAVVVGLGVAAVDETCSVDGALQYLTCQVPGPGACLDSLTEEANDWCRTYLSIEPVTSYASTSVPIVQETTTETSTTATTTTEVT
jgi:hypothetical protein